MTFPDKRRSDRRRTADAPETGTRLSALEIHDNVLAPAERELERPTSALFLSALASGLAIGFSFLAGAFLATQVSAEHRQAAIAAGYPLGFIFVILARSELFTENTLEPIMPLLHRRDLRTLRLVGRLWVLLLVGNLIGTFIYAWVLVRSPMVRSELHVALRQLALDTTSQGFGLTFYNAIFAGWLIALLAWLLAATRSTTAQLLLIWLTTAPISAFQFKHSIVGSVEAFYRVVDGSAAMGDMLASFVAPAVLGNAVGGVLLVALLNYGQVAEEHRRGKR